MKIKYVCFIVLLVMFGTAGMAQEVTLSGVVTDADGASLPYVSVKAMTKGTDSTSVAVTDAGGRYQILIGGGDSCHVEYSFIGYKTYTFDFVPRRKSVTHNVVLHADEAMLADVVVKGNVAIRQTEKTMYFPTVAQRKSTDTGSGLLYNMMIPELKTDRKTGKAETTDGKTVTLCINGLPVSDKEIKALRPADVIRVDFYPVGAGRFAQYDAVVDFVVRQREHGGYVDLRTSTTFFTPDGNYDATGKLHNRKWEHLFLAGAGFSDDRKSGSDSEETVALEPLFTKNTYNEDCHKKEYNVYGMYGVTYSNDNMSLKFISGISRDNVPDDNSRNSMVFSPELFSATQAEIKQDSKGLSPNAGVDMNVRLKGEQSLTVNADYKYIHCDYNRIYSENAGEQPLLTHAAGNNHIFGGKAVYTNNVKGVGSLSLGVSANSERYETEYDGNTKNRQRLAKWYYTLMLGLRHSFSQKLYASITLRAMDHHAGINDEDSQAWLILPNADVTYNAGKGGRFMFSWQSVYINPPIEWKSALSQQVNPYEVLRGNEHLPHYVANRPFLTYSNSWRNVLLNAYAGSMFSSKSIRDEYFTENNRLIHTYAVKGSYLQALFGSQVTVYALDRNLQLSGSVTYNVRKLNNENEEYFNDFTYSLDALYNIGSLSLSAYYYSPCNVYGITGAAYYKTPETYGMSVSYTKGQWYVAVEAANLLNSRRYEETFIKSYSYQMNSNSYKAEYYPSVCLKVSYTFDFGHKKIEREDFEFDKTMNYGILRTGK